MLHMLKFMPFAAYIPVKGMKIQLDYRRSIRESEILFQQLN